MTNQNDREYPIIYDVDGDVDLSLYDDWPEGNNPFPRPHVGYGADFTTKEDLISWFIEWFETKEESKLFVDYLIKEHLIQYESSVSGFVITYRLYEQTDYWFKCIESFTANKANSK